MSPGWFGSGTSASIFIIGTFNRETGITFTRPALENTERPVTVTMGSNLLIGRDTDRLLKEVRRVLDGRGKKGHIPPMWDGSASRRIANVAVAAYVERTGQTLAPVR